MHNNIIYKNKKTSLMAKTSASIVLAVLVVALFLNGYNAVRVERDIQPKKGKALQIS